jgi:predicted ATPase/DNA-binding SARP family transcriptional activator
MWGETPPSTARSTLHVHLSSIRRRIPDVIDSSSSGYLIRIDGNEFDIQEFTDLVAEASAKLDNGQFQEASDLSSRAISMWRGRPYQELDEVDAARAERVRLMELSTVANATLARALTLQGRVSESIAHLRAIVGENPFNEPMWEELIQAYYLAGRQVDALNAYQEARTVLGEELGLEPGPRLREMEEKVLLQDPDLMREAARSIANNLPTHDSSFIGREEDLEGVLDLLLQNHLVTITGAPGIGKTRLATEVAARGIERFPGGVWLARLAGARTDADTLGTVAAAMGVTDSIEDLDLLYQSLASRPALLILDNCEHLLTSVRQFLSSRAHGGALRVLATSRTRLGVADEVVWPLRELDVPGSVDRMWESPALKLFVDRVAAAAPDISVESLDPSELVEVCRKTGGVPLALELIARWVPSLDLATVATFRFQHPSERSTASEPPHHASVADAIAWSVALLDSTHQDAFYAASVFAAPFSIGDFRVVCAGEMTHEETIDTVVTLVEASLLVPERSSGGVRYRMLEPLRDFGRDRLDREQLRMLGDQHARWFASRATEIAEANGTEREAAAFAEVDRSIADYRLAMRHLLDIGRPQDAAVIAGALQEWWFSCYLDREGLRWLEECLAHEMDDGHRLAALSSILPFAMSAANSAERERYQSEVLALSERLGDRRAQAKALQWIGSIRANQGNTEEGIELFERAIDLYEALGDGMAAARCRVNIGIFPSSTGDVERARRVLTGVLDAPETAAYPKIASAAHRYLSLAAWHDDDEESARHHLKMALAIADRANDRRIMAGALVQTGLVDGRWGNPAKAARATLEALHLVPARHGIVFPLTAYGAVPALAAHGEWLLLLRFLDHCNEAYLRVGYASHDRLNAVAPFYRQQAEAALVASGQAETYDPVATATIVDELVAKLKVIAGEAVPSL